MPGTISAAPGTPLAWSVDRGGVAVAGTDGDAEGVGAVGVPGTTVGVPCGIPADDAAAVAAEDDGGVAVAGVLGRAGDGAALVDGCSEIVGAVMAEQPVTMVAAMITPIQYRIRRLLPAVLVPGAGRAPTAGARSD